MTGTTIFWRGRGWYAPEMNMWGDVNLRHVTRVWDRGFAERKAHRQHLGTVRWYDHAPDGAFVVEQLSDVTLNWIAQEVADFRNKRIR